MATSGSSSILEQLDTNKSLLKQLIEVSKEIEKEKQSNSVEIFLKTIIKDIKRVENETLEIIPVSHYSLSSAVHVWQRLSEKKPKVIFLEAPEDFEGELENENVQSFLKEYNFEYHLTVCHLRNFFQ